MKEKLKPKEAKLLSCYLQGMTLSECAINAGYKCKNELSAATTGHLVLKSLDVTMEDVLELNGLTDDFIARKTQEGLEAERVEVATFRGSIGDVRSFPDYATRAKYLDILAKLKGRYIERKELTGKDGGELTLVVKPAGSRALGQAHILEIE